MPGRSLDLAARSLLIGSLLVFGSSAAFADAAPEPPTPPQSQAETAPPIDTNDPHFGLTYQQGTFDVGSNLASVTTKVGFSYLDAANARRLLVDVWGNPPQAAVGILGAIVPTDIALDAPESWAAIIAYEDSGHVSDDDAASLDYDELLAEMKEASVESNQERKKAGYEAVELVGWAEPPHYEQKTHKVYWAKQLRFATAPSDTLNYFVRALGREGVLELNVIADMNALKDVSMRSPELLAMVDFKPGQRYEDFNPETDSLAAYGLAGLVAGGIAAKTGLLKGLLIFLAASWKFIAIGAVALFTVLGGVLRRLWSGGNTES
jgi:uncharacterized membrane-anchored protein